MALICGNLIALLLFVLVWPRLPAWLRAALHALTVGLLAGLLLYFHRLSVVSAIGQVFVSIGQSGWTLIRALASTLLYAVAGQYPGSGI